MKEMVMMMTMVRPERVVLRDERVWVRDFSGRGDSYEGQWIPYREQPDSELDAILAAAKTPSEVIAGWFIAVRRYLRQNGIHLIPGQIKRAAMLPVRQVYVMDGQVFRIEADGRITDRLF